MGELLRGSARALALLAIVVVLLVWLMQPPPIGDVQNFAAPGTFPSSRGLLHDLHRLLVGPDRADRAFCVANNCVADRFGNEQAPSATVTNQVRAAVPTTISLLAVTVVMWFVLVPVLAVLAIRRPRPYRWLIDATGLLGRSLPTFAITLAALTYLAYFPQSQTMRDWFGFRVAVFPIGGYHAFSISNWWPWLHALLLPALVLTLPLVGVYARLLRSTLGEEFASDHIVAARSRGVSESRLIWQHAMRAAVVPLVALASTEVVLIITGDVVLEWLFGLPGLGRLTMLASNFDIQELLQPPAPDRAVLLGVGVVTACFAIVAKVVAEAAMRALDPRLR